MRDQRHIPEACGVRYLVGMPCMAWNAAQCVSAKQKVDAYRSRALRSQRASGKPVEETPREKAPVEMESMSWTAWVVALMMTSVVGFFFKKKK